MKPGKIKLFFILIFILLFSTLNADDKILTAPIINLENLEPSYENLENETDPSSSIKTKLKKREIIDKTKNNIKYVNLIGLDKITAKTIKIKIKLEKQQNLEY